MDFFEEYVEDVFDGMLFTDDNGKEVWLELTKEKLERIADKFRHNRDVKEWFSNIDSTCQEIIAEEFEDKGLHIY